MVGVIQNSSDALQQRLENPRFSVGIDQFARSFVQSEIAIDLQPGRAITNPRFLGRVRGALGEALKRLSCSRCVESEFCDCAPPGAFHMLFRFKAAKAGGQDVPRPYVLSFDVHDRRATVRLRLFGMAVEWTEEVAAGLLIALREGLGLKTLGRWVESPEFILPDQLFGAAVMVFETPLDLRLNRHDKAKPSGPQTKLIMSIVSRVTGIARWHEALIDDDFRALKAYSAMLDARLIAEDAARWRRYSRRQERWIPMDGSRPVLLLSGELGALLPYLAMGVVVHAGSHTALGLGRYRLVDPAASAAAAEQDGAYA